MGNGSKRAKASQGRAIRFGFILKGGQPEEDGRNSV